MPSGWYARLIDGIAVHIGDPDPYIISIKKLSCSRTFECVSRPAAESYDRRPT
jgi:hypothetical protein